MVRASEVAKKGFQKDTNEKRSALDVDLKSSLSKPAAHHHQKKKDKDSRSAELSQIKDENGMVNLSVQMSSRNSNSPSIEQVGKKYYVERKNSK